MKQLIISIFSGLLAGILGAWCMLEYESSQHINLAASNFDSTINQAQIKRQFASSKNLSIPFSSLPLDENFTIASKMSTQSVVFIETLSEVEYRAGSWMDWFFEPRSSQRIGSGSGVVFSDKGHIITNNHVISEADEITVISGKRSYKAKLIGRDPSSDLAVLKINSNDLPVINKGNSEEVQVGEWVLAVGNPFNLTSTVTAGIVSAKGRNINILKDKFPIESFIQTDAAINPGNSGGALVNIKGELIGINTAILSRTGSYAGYGFAIPINIVKKVFRDIVKYGEIQKAFLGADYIDIDADLAEKLEIIDLEGVIVADVQPKGASDKAGLRKGDIIRKINNIFIYNKASIEEIIGKSYPGDELTLLIERDQEKLIKKLILTNRNGTYGIIRKEIYYSKQLKASFETIPLVERESMGIYGGIRVVDFEKNGFFYNLGIPKGFIITQINNRSIKNSEEFDKIMANIRGRFDIIGVNKNGRKVYYPFRR